MPYMPGWVYDSPPPLVFMGSVPPGPRWPSADEGAALALGAEAQILEVQQGGDGEAVVAHEDVDVVRA